MTVAAPDAALLVRRPDVLEAQLSAAEVVLLGPESEEYYGLDPIAADVWRRLERPASFAALVEALAADYDAPAAVIADDLRPLIDDLVAGGLLERRDDAA